jgi:hypothetical protein
VGYSFSGTHIRSNGGMAFSYVVSRFVM